MRNRVEIIMSCSKSEGEALELKTDMNCIEAFLGECYGTNEVDARYICECMPRCVNPSDIDFRIIIENTMTIIGVLPMLVAGFKKIMKKHKSFNGIITIENLKTKKEARFELENNENIVPKILEWIDKEDE